jgi:hypothetical protein
MQKYEQELAGIYMNIVYMRRMGTYFTDETSCEEKFKCDYIGTCYNGLDILKHIPAGYKGPRPEYDINYKDGCEDHNSCTGCQDKNCGGYKEPEE